MTLQTALEQGRSLLEQAGIGAPRLTAEVLLCHALGRERSWLYAHGDDELSELAWIHYGRYLFERSNGKPTQYITRRQEFYGREFTVTPAVLIPRPETEHVVEEALLLVRPGHRVLDVGCGSGAIAVTVQLETGCEMIATDISAAAVAVARDNAARLRSPVRFVACDLAAAISARSIDLLVSNPPYVPDGDLTSVQREVREYEPHVALFGGPGGLDFYRRIVADAPRVLRPGGSIVFELDYRAWDPVRSMLDGRWKDVGLTSDLAGLPRVLKARYSP